MRTFDSGLSAPIRTLVRNDVIAKLGPMLRSAGAFAQAIVPYPFAMKYLGQDDYEIDLLLDIVGNMNPVYAVGVGDMPGKRAGAAGNNMGTLDVDVYCFTNHMRHLTLGRLEADPVALAVDTADPGIEVMLELARMYLTDTMPGPLLGTKAKELRFVGEHHMVTLREATLWCSRYSVEVELTSKTSRTVYEYITELKTTHKIGAGSTPAPLSGGLLLVKPSGIAGWDSGAFSNESIAGDGYVEAIASGANNTVRAFGLSLVDSGVLDTTIDYSIRFSGTGQYTIREDGAIRASMAYVLGDTFRVRRTGTQIDYLKNGVVQFSSALPSVGPLFVDASLNTVAAQLGGIRLNRAGVSVPITWASLVGLTSTGPSPLIQTITTIPHP